MEHAQSLLHLHLFGLGSQLHARFAASVPHQPNMELDVGQHHGQTAALMRCTCVLPHVVCRHGTDCTTEVRWAT